MDKQLNHSKRYGAALSLIMIDIDNFKEYNDNYGHPEGDKCLIDIAKILSSISRRKYHLFRYGGDEFIAVVPQSVAKDALVLAETMRKSVLNAKIRREYSSVTNFVSVTLGILSVIPSDSVTADDMIKKVDEALYDAKRKGRNRVTVA